MLRPNTVEAQSGVVRFGAVRRDVLGPVLGFYYGHSVTLSLTSVEYLDRFFEFVDMYNLRDIAEAARRTIVTHHKHQPHVMGKLIASVRCMSLYNMEKKDNDDVETVEEIDDLIALIAGFLGVPWVMELSHTQLMLLLDFAGGMICNKFEGFLIAMQWIAHDLDDRLISLDYLIDRTWPHRDWTQAEVAAFVAHPLVVQSAQSSAQYSRLMNLSMTRLFSIV